MPQSDQGRGSSVGETVATEHRRLDALFAETRAALRLGVADEAKSAFARLREELETHFEQEDRLYYPAIWAVRPDRKAGLMVFVEAHERLRARFARIAECLESDRTDEAEQAFQEFSEDFARHEVGEESLLRSLEEEVAALG